MGGECPHLKRAEARPFDDCGVNRLPSKGNAASGGYGFGLLKLVDRHRAVLRNVPQESRGNSVC